MPISRQSRTAVLYRRAGSTVLFGLLVNIGLASAKLAGGILGHSFALISDAVNSVGDVFASAAVLLGLWVARRPADAEHPYGHTRAEAIAGSNVALLMVLSALAVGWHAISQIAQPHDLPPAWTLWIAATSVVIKESLYQYNVRIGKRVGSSAVIANAWDHRSDALCSLAAFVGLAIIRWGGPRFVWVDEVAALVVVAVIVWCGVSLFRTSANELMDVQADDRFIQQVRDVASSVPGVEYVETLWVRKSGLEYFADIHIEVDGQLSVAEGHEIGHHVKDAIRQRFPVIRDALVHLEPYPHRDR